MAIKVLIERKIQAGHEDLVWNMLRKLRSEAVRQKGYLYGETWRSLDNPRIGSWFPVPGVAGSTGRPRSTMISGEIRISRSAPSCGNPAPSGYTKS